MLKKKSMYKLVYASKAEHAFMYFIDSYKNASMRLFYDTGIDDYLLILENYNKAWDALYEKLIERNIWILSWDVVLWRKQKVSVFEVHYNFSSFHVCLEYTEDTQSKTRYIENIIFTRK